MDDATQKIKRQVVAPYGNPVHDAIAVVGGVLAGLLIGAATTVLPELMSGGQ